MNRLLLRLYLFLDCHGKRRALIWIDHRSLCDALRGSSRQAGRVPAFRLAGLGGPLILADERGRGYRVFLLPRGLPPLRAFRRD
jgi:hypothetical protein